MKRHSNSKQIPSKKVEKRRHIEDAPFYKLIHGFDDLPLDPARPLLEQHIRRYSLGLMVFGIYILWFLLDKFRFWKTQDFRNDYILHYYPASAGTDITDGIVLPEKMIQILENREWNYSHQTNALGFNQNCPWLNLEDGGK